MEAQPLVFQSAVEALVRRIPEVAKTPALREAVRAAGIDLDAALLPAYPVEVWGAAVEAMARTLAPDVPLEQAARQLGRLLIDGYEEQLIGRALFASLRLIGPRRALERTARAFRNGNNYAEASVTEHGPRDVELYLKELGTPPGFAAGILEAGLRRAGARDVQLELLGAGPDGLRFHIRWR